VLLSLLRHCIETRLCSFDEQSQPLVDDVIDNADEADQVLLNMKNKKKTQHPQSLISELLSEAMLESTQAHHSDVVFDERCRNMSKLVSELIKVHQETIPTHSIATTRPQHHSYHPQSQWFAQRSKFNTTSLCINDILCNLVWKPLLELRTLVDLYDQQFSNASKAVVEWNEKLSLLERRYQMLLMVLHTVIVDCATIPNSTLFNSVYLCDIIDELLLLDSIRFLPRQTSSSIISPKQFLFTVSPLIKLIDQYLKKFIFVLSSAITKQSRNQRKKKKKMTTLQ
jgi:hypothetical protein